MRRNYDPEKLSRYRYPNLVAEFMESGYSICTLSEHMGLGARQEDDKLINAKIFGNEEISFNEAIGLAQLFSCKISYLFADELEIFGGRPVAYIRHYESNKQQERDMELYRLSEEIRRALKERPDLADFLKLTLSCTEQQIQYAAEKLMEVA
ncbi:MAG: hypothetical protein K1W22_18110 [Lachnospiraceae bacterium]